MKEGWTYKKLGEVATFQNGFAFKSSLFRKDGLPIVRISSIQDGKIKEDDLVSFYPSDYNVNFDNYKILPNDILIAMSGGTTGKLGINKSNKTFYQNQRVGVIRENKKFLNHFFLYYYLHTKSEESLKIAAGAAQPNLSTAQIKDFIIPLPTLDEQRAIVARLDSAFAQIDSLKANAERQLAEARKLFQKALEEAMTPKEGWEEKTLKEVSQIAGDYGLNVSSKPFDGIRYLRITDITDWGDLNDDKVSAKVDSDKKQEELEEGDILFARTGATVGKTLVYRKEFGECLYAGYLIRYRLKKDCVLPRYMHYITHSKEYYDWVSTNQEAAAQPNISARKYNLLPIHYPSLETQHTIVAHLDDLSSHVRALEEKLRKMKDECDALKQAMLREIFE